MEGYIVTGSKQVEIGVLFEIFLGIWIQIHVSFIT